MAHVIIPPGWQMPESAATDPDTYRSRRAFVKQFGLAIGAAAAGATAFPAGAAVLTSGAAATSALKGPLDTIPANAPREGLPAARNAAYAVPERVMTDRIAASSYNNFYEFINSGDLKNVWPLTDDFQPFPHTIVVKGLVEQEFRMDVSALIRSMPLEERVYRFRCVEAWSMTVPWTGFPLKALIARCRPLSKATHVKFLSMSRPKQMPGIPATPWYSWPYYEGLRMDEATNDLAFVATGMYGEPLPKQSGSPLRLALPWKYGYKGPKAIAAIEFTDSQPATFWNDLQPAEYPFLSNVNPNIPHPRWTQASERFIASTEDIRRVPTQMFNGYDEWVGEMYPGEARMPLR